MLSYANPRRIRAVASHDMLAVRALEKSHTVDKRGFGDWSSQQGSSSTFTLNVPSITTARLHVGFAYDDIRYYLTGGAGYVRFTGTAIPATTFSSTQTVWVAGLGQEFAINRNLLLRFEALYMHPLGNTVTFPSITSGTPTGGTMYDVIGRVGLSYKFGWPGN